MVYPNTIPYVHYGKHVVDYRRYTMVYHEYTSYVSPWYYHGILHPGFTTGIPWCFFVREALYNVHVLCKCDTIELFLQTENV